MIDFKPHAREDVPLRVKWLNNKAATIYAIDNPDKLTDIHEQEQWFNNYESNPTKKFFTIFDEVPIGFMGLSNIDNDLKTASVFILIGEDHYRSRGIGKQAMKYLTDIAFNDVGLKSLSLQVDKRNNAAIALYRSIGFRETSSNYSEIKMELMKYQ